MLQDGFISEYCQGLRMVYLRVLPGVENGSRWVYLRVLPELENGSIWVYLRVLPGLENGSRWVYLRVLPGLVERLTYDKCNVNKATGLSSGYFMKSQKTQIHSSDCKYQKSTIKHFLQYSRTSVFVHYPIHHFPDIIYAKLFSKEYHNQSENKNLKFIKLQHE